jgi:YbbR domain-containing protein
MNPLTTLTDWLDRLLPMPEQEAEESRDRNRERILVFAFALLLAFFLWFWVKMSRDYSVRLPMSVTVGALPSDLALREDVPEQVRVSLTGEGWQLLSWSINPPELRLDVRDEMVMLPDQIRQQIDPLFELTLNDVEPSVLILDLEPVVERKVPLTADLDLRYRNRFGPVGSIRLQPDSVMIRGGASKVEGITSWPVMFGVIQNIAAPIRRDVVVEAPPAGLEVEPRRTLLFQDVAEFTEGEATVPIQVVGLPLDLRIEFTPAAITVRYLIPIERFRDAQQQTLFSAVVSYASIQNDDTGFIVPEISVLYDGAPVRIQSFQPASVAYFKLVE